MKSSFPDGETMCREDGQKSQGEVEEKREEERKIERH